MAFEFPIPGDRLPTAKVGRWEYYREFRRSKLVLSPFGYGEITLKDFEVFLTGGVLVKPSMDCIETWPPFFEENVTNLPVDWDLESLEAVLEGSVGNYPEVMAVAHAGQQRYRHYLTGPAAEEEFTTRFAEMVFA